jgi:chromosomal replication initiation ATPase DnaA
VSRQLVFDLPHRAALGMEDFLVADSNRAAVAWIDRWPEWPGPLVIVHGPEGCGKTHLAHVWQARSGAAVIAAAALAGIEPGALPRRFAFVIEDVSPPLAASAERQLFHLYDVAAGSGAHVLATSLVSPAHWNVVLPDLASRVGAAPQPAIGAPDDALLAAVIVKLFADRQLKVGEEIVTYLLARIERSFAAARRIVAAIDAAALAENRKVTVALARAVLEGRT